MEMGCVRVGLAGLAWEARTLLRKRATHQLQHLIPQLLNLLVQQPDAHVHVRHPVPVPREGEKVHRSKQSSARGFQTLLLLALVNHARRESFVVAQVLLHRRREAEHARISARA